MEINLSTVSVISIATIATFAGSAVYSQSLPAPGQSEDGWRHTIGAYAFLPARTHGTSTIAGRSADIDLDLGDVLDLLDFAAAGRYEAWNGDFGVIVDANYAAIGHADALPGPLGSGIEVDVRQKWFGVLAAYRVADGTYGASNQRYTFDIQGGARYNSIRQTIDITTPGPGVPPTLGGDEGWFEPVIGARGMWKLNDKWTTVASMDLGGFGAGGNDLQIGVNIGFDYQPWDNTAITFGYRYFSIDYSDTLPGGEFAYDMVQHGPYVGVKYFFK
ncbi:hypothetical protein [Parasedimentitalea psychrophila]|uniref:Uncharacterized protein n=1 Tax=Parasedimentitalea psychrophila TaxID=2997337 RepID=A0A9Y2L0B4_9RHOB|nr:hypothetical protein [Parasedimentitalea psychrophila]WIY25042.1 hypothetical protein QPJ95_21555 [Parasedimentitalea psychrophila]